MSDTTPLDTSPCCPAPEGIDGHWLIEQHSHHTCGTAEGGYYGQHEPGCGEVPLVDLQGLPGWDTLVAYVLAEHAEAGR